MSTGSLNGVLVTTPLAGNEMGPRGVEDRGRGSVGVHGPATTFGHYLRYYKENTGLFSVAAWLSWESRLPDCAHLPPAPTSA